MLNTCQLHSISHFIKFNTVKRKILVIRSHSFLKFDFPKFHLNGSNLEEVTQYKYLGHIITSNLTDESDITRTVKSVYASGMNIFRRFNMCYKGVKLKLFPSYCSEMSTTPWASGKKLRLPIILYSLGSWGFRDFLMIRIIPQGHSLPLITHSMLLMSLGEMCTSFSL